MWKLEKENRGSIKRKIKEDEIKIRGKEWTILLVKENDDGRNKKNYWRKNDKKG